MSYNFPTLRDVTEGRISACDQYRTILKVSENMYRDMSKLSQASNGQIMTILEHSSHVNSNLGILRKMCADEQGRSLNR